MHGIRRNGTNRRHIDLRRVDAVLPQRRPKERAELIRRSADTRRAPERDPQFLAVINAAEDLAVAYIKRQQHTDTGRGTLSISRTPSRNTAASRRPQCSST